MRLVNVAVIGLGYWGPNYIRALSQVSKVNVKYLCDKDPEKLSHFSNKGYELTSDYRVLVDDRLLDAVFVVTPASTHFEIAKLMLENGKHVLIEKPLTMTYGEAVKLWHLSEELDKVLMVGHVYVYHPAVNYIKSMLNNEELGRLYYGIGLRMGLGPIRNDANCLWDLAPHELSILDHLLGKMPAYVSAQASSFLRNDRNIYDYATACLTYEDGFSFTLMTGWYSPEKVRLINLIGSRKMLKFDDTNKSNPLTIYEKNSSLILLESKADYGTHQVQIREGNIVIPYVSQEEPLLLQLNHFIDSITNNRRPLTDGYQGARVVAILEAMEDSIRRNGSKVEVKAEEVG